MYKGIYIAASAAAVKDAEVSVITRNLANASTAGYKSEGVAFSAYILPLVREVGYQDRVMVEKGRVVTDFSPGSFIHTGNPLHVAIRGDGFFTLEGGLYTRRGDFRIDAEGYLVNVEGRKVLGGDGEPIRIPQGGLTIGADGEVTVDGAAVGRLKVVDFPRPYNLTKVGDSTFIPSGAQRPREVSSGIVQGELEASNVNVFREMTRLIRTVREFEAYQRMIRAFDNAAAKALNEIGRI